MVIGILSICIHTLNHSKVEHQHWKWLLSPVPSEVPGGPSQTIQQFIQFCRVFEEQRGT